MSEIDPLTGEDEDETASERSLAEDLRALAGDGQAFLKSELTYQKARISYATSGVRGIALYGLLALALVFFALMALTVGLLLALTPLLTAWGATAAVVICLLAVAAFASWRAFSKWQRVMLMLSDRGTER